MKPELCPPPPPKVRVEVRPPLLAALEAEAAIARASGHPLSEERLRSALSRWAVVRVLCVLPVAVYAAEILARWAADDERGADARRWERLGDALCVIALLLILAIAFA